MEKEKDNFFQRVHEVARTIPVGRVTTYGAIAAHLGAPKSSRMVGWAMNNSHGTDVPAHRVVNRLGMLTGKAQFTSPTEMEERLRAEGVVVKEDKVVDFEALFWEPI